MVTACVYLFGAIFYSMTASGERQDWSKMEPYEESHVSELFICMASLFHFLRTSYFLKIFMGQCLLHMLDRGLL
jgi:hypothetical protein